MTYPDLSVLPDIALSGDDPVFGEPWEAQVFAMVINLHQHQAFTWDEWASCLSAEIHSGHDRAYYDHWLVALETILTQKNLVSAPELDSCTSAWHIAAQATPHGMPIVLKR